MTKSYFVITGDYKKEFDGHHVEAPLNTTVVHCLDCQLPKQLRNVFTLNRLSSSMQTGISQMNKILQEKRDIMLTNFRVKHTSWQDLQ